MAMTGKISQAEYLTETSQTYSNRIENTEFLNRYKNLADPRNLLIFYCFKDRFSLKKLLSQECPKQMRYFLIFQNLCWTIQGVL